MGAPPKPPPRPPKPPSTPPQPPSQPPPKDLPSWVDELPEATGLELGWRERLRGPGRLSLVAGGALFAVLLIWWVWPSGTRKTTAESAPSAASSVALPPSAVASFEKARAEARKLFQAARYGEAAAAYRRAVALSPGHAAAFAGLGAACSRAGDRAGALAAYQEAVRLQPDHAGFRAALGRAYRDSGQNDRAEMEYRKAFELDPKNQSAQQALKELARK